MAEPYFHPGPSHTPAVHDCTRALLETINQRSKLKSPPPLDLTRYTARTLELHLGEDHEIKRPFKPDPFSILLGYVLAQAQVKLRGGIL
jgi:hypothetical protein